MKDFSALARILHVAHTLEGRLEQDLSAVGLSLAKLNVLRALASTDAPLTLGDIAENVGCVRSNVTQLVDRLEAEGLARRVADEADRRVKRAQLTPAGRRSHTDGVAILERHEAAAAEALGEDLTALTRALDRLVP
jgi:DNA-binding MarR family transcriptional regulator